MTPIETILEATATMRRCVDRFVPRMQNERKLQEMRDLASTIRAAVANLEGASYLHPVLISLDIWTVSLFGKRDHQAYGGAKVVIENVRLNITKIEQWARDHASNSPTPTE